MFCKKCSQENTIKETEKFITILCKCQIVIIYNTTIVKTITKQQYKKNYNQ